MKINFLIRRILSWLIDSFLFIAATISAILLFDTIDRHWNDITPYFGAQFTLDVETGVIELSRLTKLWNSYGELFIYCAFPLVFIMLSRLLDKKWLTGSIGKKIMKLQVHESTSKLQLLMSFFAFVVLYFVFIIITPDYITTLLHYILYGYIIDILFIFVTGQLLHNYILRIKII